MGQKPSQYALPVDTREDRVSGDAAVTKSIRTSCEYASEDRVSGDAAVTKSIRTNCEYASRDRISGRQQ
jgi:hypothetical protein